MTAALLAIAFVLALGARFAPRPAPRRELRAEQQPTPVRKRWWPLPIRRRTRPPTAGEVAGWCDDLARATRSGSTLSNAIRCTAPPASFAATVEQIVHALDRGVPLRDALHASGPTSPHVDLALIVVRACADNGGPPSEPIDRAATTLRGREADAADRRTQSAQARLSAQVMTALPGAMLGVLWLTSGATRDAVATRYGLVLISVGVALNLIGWRWMRAIVNGGRP